MKIPLLLVLILASALSAQNWTNIGPATESPQTIAYDPTDENHVVAGSFGFISVSKDGGDSWSVLHTFEDGSDFMPASIEFSTITPATYYVGGMIVYDINHSANGVYRTTDGGDTFEQILTAPSAGFRLHPLDNDVMVCYYSDFEGSVFRTTDGGANWTNIGSGNLQTVSHIALDPFDTETLYASTFTGLKKSTDGGQTWSSSGFDGTSMFLMETHPTIPDKVYTGTGVFVSPEGFYESVDGGQTWSEIPLPYGDFVIDLPRQLKFAPSDPDVMYVGETNEIFYSDNAGQTWSKKQFQESTFFYTLGLTIHPVDSDIAIATSDTRSVKTTNAGQDWENFALPLNQVHSLEVLLDGGVERIYAGTTYGNLRYDSDTGQWEDYTDPAFIGIESRALGVDPEMPELLLIGIQNAFWKSLVGRSTDYGESGVPVWTNFNTSGGGPSTLKNDPLNSGVFYFATFTSVGQDDLIKSTDFGETWSPLDGDHYSYTDIAVDHVNNGTLYVSGDGLITKSTDSGASFVSASNGLPTAYGIYCVDISPFNPDVLVCSNDVGVYRTTDGGVNWVEVLDGVSCKNVEFSKTHPGIAVLISWDDQVLLSYDDGETWIDYQGDLPAAILSDVRFSPDGTLIYVGTLGQSIYSAPVELPVSDISCSLTLSSSSGDGEFDVELIVTNDADASAAFDIWLEVTGPEYYDENWVKLGKHLHPDSSKIAGGHYRITSEDPGIYTLSVFIGTYPDVVESSCSADYTKSSLLAERGRDAMGLIPHEFGLAQNHPNPFNPETTIRYQLPEVQHVQLTVFDLLGREIRTLVNGAVDAGHHEVVWDGTNAAGTQVASGIYVYRMTAGKFVENRRMVLLR